MGSQSGTRRLYAIEYLVEDGYLVITHARGYESPKDIGTENFTVINFTELTTFLDSALPKQKKS